MENQPSFYNSEKEFKPLKETSFCELLRGLTPRLLTACN